MYRAIVRDPEVISTAPDKIEADKQSFHATLQSAQTWASKMKTDRNTIEIYEQTEVLVHRQ